MAGVAFEAHGQNTLLVVDMDRHGGAWRLRGFCTRDFGGIFIEPSACLKAATSLSSPEDTHVDATEIQDLARAHNIDNIFDVCSYTKPGSAIIASSAESVQFI